MVARISNQVCVFALIMQIAQAIQMSGFTCMKTGLHYGKGTPIANTVFGTTGSQGTFPRLLSSPNEPMTTWLAGKSASMVTMDVRFRSYIHTR